MVEIKQIQNTRIKEIRKEKKLGKNIGDDKHCRNAV